jgi:pimeloyl-ACP methyl ester carboxylesterase
MPSALAVDPSQPALGHLTGRNYSFAVYNSENHLIHTPIEHLRAEVARRESAGENPLTDVYLVSHGWNYTVEEAVALYQNYLISLGPAIARAKESDPDYEPYFVFVAWGSVTRPLTQSLESLSVVSLPSAARFVTTLFDEVVFHVLSNWGETQDAFRLALGGKDRLTFDRAAYPGADEPCEYDRIVAAAQAAASESPFYGYEVPVSVLIDALIRLRAAAKRPLGVHTIGHSYGGKLVSLATLDACTRARRGLEARGTAPAGPLIDSMVLITPAMKVTEMYYPLREAEAGEPAPLITRPVQQSIESIESLRRAVFFEAEPNDFKAASESIARKAIVFTKFDSANGWLFGLGQVLISNDVLAEQDLSRGADRVFGLPLFAADLVLILGQSLAANVVSLAADPLDALGETFEADDAGEFVSSLVQVPLAPITARQSMGHRGLRTLRFVSLYVSFRNTWLRDAQDYLNSRIDCPSREFVALSSAYGAASDCAADAGPYYLFDAKEVYSGYNASVGPVLGKVLNQLDVSKAHGDLRSYDIVDGLQKRERTFRFLYSFTRRRPAAAGKMPGEKARSDAAASAWKETAIRG